MEIINLSQLESRALMKDQMDAVKGGGDPFRYDKCLSCLCPKDGLTLEEETYLAAKQDAIGPDV
ncbi:MAG: hypothetical protein J6Y27_00995 [Bacteroidales bacterium]|nr:hypothetical protein [Bacteroidales bacterium]